MAGETQPTAPSPSSPASPPASPAASPPAVSSPAPTPSSNPGSPVPAAVAQPDPSHVAVPVARPSYVPENYWDSQGNKLKDEKAYSDWVNGNAAAVAAENSRRLTLPQSPDAYKPELPATFKPPEGLEFKVDDKDPLITQYRALAHKAGLDQTTFSEGLGLIAALRVGEQVQIKAAYDAEIAKLGASGADRVDAVAQWLNAVGGPKAASLANIFKMAPMADTVEAVETIMQRFSSQGVTPFNQSHRVDAPQDGKIPGYENMSFEQRRFAQDQLAARRAAR